MEFSRSGAIAVLSGSGGAPNFEGHVHRRTRARVRRSGPMAGGGGPPAGPSPEGLRRLLLPQIGRSFEPSRRILEEARDGLHLVARNARLLDRLVRETREQDRVLVDGVERGLPAHHRLSLARQGRQGLVRALGVDLVARGLQGRDQPLRIRISEAQLQQTLARFELHEGVPAVVQGRGPGYSCDHKSFHRRSLARKAPWLAPRLGHGFADRPHRPHLDTAHRRRGNLRGELDGLVQVARLDEIEPGETFLGLGKRPVGHRQLAVPYAHGGGGGDRLQRLGGDAVAARADPGVELHAMAVVHRLDSLLLAVDQAEVLHGWPWSCGSRTGLPPPALALATRPSTSSWLPHDRQTSTSVLFLAPSTIMQAALSSVNCALKPKPRREKKALERSRSRTGRLTKICRAMISPYLKILRAVSTAGLSPKSSSSKYGRTSISPAPPSIDGLGKRLVQASASSRDLTSMMV